MTLYRSESANGPFVIVPDGSAIMSPANRRNPDITDGEGHFGWDVIAGFYKVRAERESCFSPDDAQQPYAESAVLTIPPPVTDLDIRLECPSPLGVPAGDVDCSGFVTGVDALQIARYSLGLQIAPDPDCPEIGGAVAASNTPNTAYVTGDVDCDDAIDFDDVMTVLRFAAGLQVAAPPVSCRAIGS